MKESLRIERLRREHRVDSFDCGREALNRVLVRYALQNQQAEASQTDDALAGDEVAGFYTLVVAQVDYDDAPARPRLVRGQLAILLGQRGRIAQSNASLVGPRVLGQTSAGRTLVPLRQGGTSEMTRAK